MRLVVRLVGRVDVDHRFGFDAFIRHLLGKGPFSGVLLDRASTGAGHDRTATAEQRRGSPQREDKGEGSQKSKS
jgi:hypothetical protein